MSFSTSFQKKATGSLVYQYLATFTGCLSIIAAGMHFGWPSPSLPKLLHEDSHIPITNEEGSWLASMPCIGAASGSLLAAFIVDRIGRKYCMLITSPMYLIAWIMVAYSPSVLLLNIARFLAGSADGIAFTAFPMYLGEIADSKIRGLLGSSIQLSLTLGILLINIIGAYLSITYAAIISAAVPILHFISFYYMPESPYYLIMKDKFGEARKSLQKFDGVDDVDLKLGALTKAVQSDAKTETGSSIWSLFTVRSNRKAVIIVFGLRAVQQFSGVNAITFYANTIFQEAGGAILPSTASMIYFMVQLVVSTGASLLVDKVGRKPLLIISIIGSGATLALEGLYFYFNDYTNYDMSKLNFLPLVALLAYVIIFNLGMGTIPVLLLGELFPTSVKAFALCLADIFFGVIVTMVSKFFQIMKDDLGMHVPFFAFTICCVGGLAFIVLCVPETKGKTLEEIQQYLRGEPPKDDKEGP